jgi:hypothetical protein
MKKIRVDREHLLALYAISYQVHRSLFSLGYPHTDGFISYFKSRPDVLHYLQYFVDLCHQHDIKMNFWEFPGYDWVRGLGLKFVRHHYLSWKEISAAGYYCREMLEALGNPTPPGLDKSTFRFDRGRFLMYAVYPRISRRDLSNVRTIHYYFHNARSTSFELNDILTANHKLKTYPVPENFTMICWNPGGPQIK